MKRRYALFAGKKGHLVGHPGQGLNGASYICQRQLPMPEGGLKGFGEPGYTGPEIADLYEPTVELIELTHINTRALERAVKAGHLDRSEVMLFNGRDDAEAAREKLTVSLVARAEQAAKAKAESRAKVRTAPAAEGQPDKSLETERALLAQLKAIDETNGGAAFRDVGATEA